MKLIAGGIVFCSLIGSSLGTPLPASDPRLHFSAADIAEQLREYQQNIPQFHLKLPLKKSLHSGQETQIHYSPEMKIHWRKQFFPLDMENEDKSAIKVEDRVEDLVEHPDLIRNIRVMEEKKLTAGIVKTQPWSDTYWPVYAGILGARYADKEFIVNNDFLDYYHYVQKAPALNIYGGGDKEKIDLLSPAEKFDLLLGTNQTILTQKLWDEGNSYQEANGQVESWMGICHGWAPASFMNVRPLHKVTVMSADGKTPLTFYPSDIKGLLSLSWAKGNVHTRFIGGRCNEKEPQMDETTGRTLPQECFDNNPGSWHMSIVNKVGVHKESFVLDATYDYEVWNQPILSYSYKYFNVKNQQSFDNFKDAKVALTDHPQDTYKKYRSPQAKALVGVAMELIYMSETNPTHREMDDEKRDSQSSALYLYDLELDDKDNIVGGEWYQNYHPDFLWTPDLNARPYTSYDYFLLGSRNWDGQQTLSPTWKDNALKAAKQGRPLFRLVESLLEMSLSPMPVTE